MGDHAMRMFQLSSLVLLICIVSYVVQANNDADEKFNKEHKEMTDKLREKHNIKAPPAGRENDIDQRRGLNQHDDRRDDRYDDRDFGGDPEYRRQMRRNRDPDMPRMPRMPGGRRDMDNDMDDDDHGYDRHSRRDLDEDHNIGATRELTFTNQSLGMGITREWGHSHFLVNKVKGEAEKLGVKVGEAIVSVNGAKTRWKNLAQVTDQIRKAGRPVQVTLGEHKAHGGFGGSNRNHPEL